MDFIMHLSGLEFFLIIMAVAGAAFGATVLLERRRSGFMREAAGSLGASFSEKDPALERELLTGAGGFLFTRSERRRRIRNVLRTRDADASTVLFDYSFDKGTDSGRGFSWSMRRTVALVDVRGLGVPEFLLLPRNFSNTIVSGDSLKELVLPRLSRTHILKARDVEGVSGLFQAGLAGLFEAEPKLSAESDESRMLIYRPSRGTRKEDLRELLRTAQQTRSIAARAASDVKREH